MGILLIFAIFALGLLFFGIFDTALFMHLLPFLLIGIGAGLILILLIKVIFFRNDSIPQWLCIILILISFVLGIFVGLVSFTRDDNFKDSYEIGQETVPVSPVISIYDNLKENGIDKNNDGFIDNLDVIIEVNERKATADISNDTYFNMNILDFEDCVIFYYLTEDKYGNVIYPNLIFQKTKEGLKLDGVYGAKIKAYEDASKNAYYYTNGMFALDFDLFKVPQKTATDASVYSIYRFPTYDALIDLTFDHHGPIASVANAISRVLIKNVFDNVGYQGHKNNLSKQFFLYVSEYFLKFDNLEMMFKHDYIDIIYSIDKLSEVSSFYNDVYVATDNTNCQIDVTTRTVKMVRTENGDLVYDDDGCAKVYNCKSYFNMNYDIVNRPLNFISLFEWLFGEKYTYDVNYLNKIKIDNAFYCFQVDNSLIENQDKILIIDVVSYRCMNMNYPTSIKYEIEYNTPYFILPIEVLEPFIKGVYYVVKVYDENNNKILNSVIYDSENIVLSNIRENYTIKVYEVLDSVPELKEYNELWYIRYISINSGATEEDALIYALNTYGLASKEYSNLKTYMQIKKLKESDILAWQEEFSYLYNGDN